MPDADRLSFEQLLQDFPLEPAPNGTSSGDAPLGRARRLGSRPERGTTGAERYLQVVLAQQGKNLRRATFAAAGVYVVLALLAYSPINPLSNSDILYCGCFDPSQQVWWLGWTPFALLHHLNPYFTNYVDYPVGANMATNTLMPLLGIVGAPVTWLFGPTATLNLLLRVAFASSALAMFVTLRRFVVSQPAAFVGGLLYGFSPYMIAQGSLHLDLSFVPFPPLILGALHDVLVAPRRGPLRAGVKLGLLCVAQYFIAAEVLADTALMALFGIVILVLARPVETWRTAGYKLRALGAALAVFAPICAYPTWFEMDGPGHLVSVMPFGDVLSRPIDLLGPIVPTLHELLAPARLAAFGSSLYFSNSYDNGGYLGVTLIAVLVVTVITAFKDPLVRFCALMLPIALTCALGAQLVIDNRYTTVYLPLDIVSLWPVFSAEIAGRYSLYMQLFAAILLAVALDRTSAVVAARRRVSLPLWWAWRRLSALGRGFVRLGAAVRLPALARAARLGEAARWARLDRLAWEARLRRLGTPAAGAFAACALFALLPLVPRLPYQEVPTQVPTALLASRPVQQIPNGAVVLTYPYNEPPGTYALMWAASAEYHFRLIGGYFAWAMPNDGPGGPPGGDPFPPPTLEPTTMRQVLDAAASWSPSQFPPFDRATIDSLRLYVRRWHVDAILFQTGGGDWQIAARYLRGAFGPPELLDGYDLWLGLQGHASRHPSRRLDPRPASRSQARGVPGTRPSARALRRAVTPGSAVTPRRAA